MKKFFDEDNIVWYVIGKTADIMVLNIVFILCCIPIVTIGASATALYAVTLKMVKNEEGHVIRNFFDAFKCNFKKSTIMWLIMLFAGVLLIGEFCFMSTIPTISATIFKYVFGFIGVCYLIILSYIFPLQSKFENRIIITFLNSASIGIAYFIPWTLLIMLINSLPIILTMVDVNVLLFLLPIMMFCGFSVIACVNSFILQKIFCKLSVKD